MENRTTESAESHETPGGHASAFIDGTNEPRDAGSRVAFHVVKRVGMLLPRRGGRAVLRVEARDELRPGEAVAVANTLCHGDSYDVVFACEGKGRVFRGLLAAMWHADPTRWTRVPVEQVYLYGVFHYPRSREAIFEREDGPRGVVPNHGYYDDLTMALAVDRGRLHQAGSREVSNLAPGRGSLAYLLDEGVAMTSDPELAPWRRRS